MAKEQIEVSTILPARPEQVFSAWLDGKQHSDFTGGRAKINPVVGGQFTAWDDYIRGTTVELEPNRRIVQEWTTAEFPEGHPPSRLEVLLDEVPGGTKLTLKHGEIPEGQGESYEQGWEEHYFSPMKQYFEALGDRMPEPQMEGTPGKGLRGDAAHPVDVIPEKKAPVKKASSSASASAKKAAGKKAPTKAVAKKKPAKKLSAKSAKKSSKKPAAKKSTKGGAKKRK